MQRQCFPACNGVTPLGKSESFPLRGTFTSNRGIDHSGRVIPRSHARDSWVIRALGRSLVT